MSTHDLGLVKFDDLLVGRWLEECIGEPIPPIVELEEALRDGVTLAKLVRIFAPELVPRIFEAKKLQFRHSDNIDRFFRFLKRVELPEVSRPNPMIVAGEFLY